MEIIHSHSLLPPKIKNHQGNTRKIGVEIEFSDVSPAVITKEIQLIFGGDIRKLSRAEYLVEDTSVGTFTIELDAKYIKDIAMEETACPTEELSIEHLTKSIFTKAAEQFVPWEIVTPPLAMTQLNKVSELIKRLRKQGALGTRYAARYAFGVHLNPELPDLSATTVLHYLQAFICLYEWICQKENIDLTRRVTSYINHYDKDYILKVLDKNYRPDLTTLIDDYLFYNPTRNRSLDLLPLFKYLDEERINHAIKDTRVQARPTLHYRLPNCDIDNPDWNIGDTWSNWLPVEYIANNPTQLGELCEIYTKDLKRLTRIFDSEWEKKLSHFICEHTTLAH